MSDELERRSSLEGFVVAVRKETRKETWLFVRQVVIALAIVAAAVARLIWAGVL